MKGGGERGTDGDGMGLKLWRGFVLGLVGWYSGIYGIGGIKLHDCCRHKMGLCSARKWVLWGSAS